MILNMEHAKLYASPLGNIALFEEAGQITRLLFCEAAAPDAVYSDTALLNEAMSQLNEYFCGKRQDFTLPIRLEGTPFMQSVWAEMQSIPYGKTISYKDLALRSGYKKAYRAVGMACNRNPLPIIIPCHRVIGSNGSLTGYGGGLDKKVALLELEKRFFGRT